MYVYEINKEKKKKNPLHSGGVYFNSLILDGRY